MEGFTCADLMKRKKNKSYRAKVKSSSEMTAKTAYEILWWYEMGFGGLL